MEDTNVLVVNAQKQLQQVEKQLRNAKLILALETLIVVWIVLLNTKR